MSATLLLWLAFGVARAQSAAEQRTATVLVAQARDLERAGDLAGATLRLASAYGLGSEPEIGLELGRVLVKHGDLVRAHGILREVATRRPSGARQRKAVDQARSEAAALEKRLAWLRVDVEAPEGARTEVSIEGRAIPAGAWILLPARKQRVMVTVEKSAPLEREVVLEPGKRETLSLRVAPPPPPPTGGRLAVDSTRPIAADLFIDGERVGPLPFEGELPPGEYRIRARGVGGSSTERTVKVALGETTRVTVELAQPTGSLRVVMPYAAASVYVDGELVGRGSFTGDIAEGEHEVTVLLDGFYPETRRVSIASGRAAVLAFPRLVAVSEAKGETPRPYRGSYVRLGPALLLGLHGSSDTLAKDCIDPAECQADFPAGLGMRVGVGWSFGVLGAEYFMLGVIDRWKVTATHPVSAGSPRTEEHTFYRYGGAAGVALRASSRGDTFRVTGGVGGGLAIRAVQFRRTTAHDTPGVTSGDVTSDAAVFVAPALTADMGVLIGATPGVKFHAGVLAYAELAPFSTPSSEPIDEDFGTRTPAIDYVTGSQFYVGPTLGVQFGR